MEKIRKPIVILLIILGFALTFRVMLLGLHRMHMDECLYSSYAIRMVTHGDLSLNGGLRVDKPPVYFYFLAVSFLVNGISENAARFPNIVFSLISVFLLYLIVIRLYGKELYALLAAAVMSFSVFYTVFSVTAFQDISMTAFFLYSLLLIMERKLKLSAVMYALSIGCKPMTIFLGPVYLIFYFMLVFNKDNFKKDMIQMLAGASYVLIPLILWSGLLANPRWGIFKFFITQQPEVMNVASNYGARFIVWWEHSRYILNNHLYFIIAGAGTLIFIAYDIIKNNKVQIKNGLMSAVSVIYIYMILTVIQFRQFDRYILIVVPFISIMLGVVIGRSAEMFRNKKLIIALSVIALFPFVMYMHDIPGKDLKTGALFDGADGFDTVSEYLKKQQNQDTRIIYYGGTISWYGYFYLAESDFYSAEPVYDLKSVAAQTKDKRNILIVDTTQTDRGTVLKMKEQYQIIFTASTADIKDKYIIFNL